MELNKEQALDRASALCVKSEHCESDIRRKLFQWHLDESDADYVINRLKQDKFIDEARYANAFTREKSRIGKWGETKIRFALAAKGISEDAITEALNDNISKDDEIEALRTLLQNKMKHIKDDDKHIVRVKLLRFAASRGYSIDQVNKALKNLQESSD